MGTFIRSIIGGLGGLLVLYALLLSVLGEVFFSQNHNSYVHGKFQLGMGIATTVGACGSLLIIIALILWFVARANTATIEKRQAKNAEQ